jgi:hypothetical protein
MPERLLVHVDQGVTGRREGRLSRTPSVTAREVRRLFTVLGSRPLAVEENATTLRGRVKTSSMDQKYWKFDYSGRS